jgi:hypothetical protein
MLDVSNCQLKNDGDGCSQNPYPSKEDAYDEERENDSVNRN